MRSLRIASAVLVVVASAAFRTASAEPADDPYLWLEDVESEEALAWVRARNEPTLAALESDPRFPVLYEEAEALLNATDRIPGGTHRDGWFYNFWQDADHVRGIWRRCTLESYRTDAPEWETLIDFDALAESEGENWVFKESTPLEPDFDRVLVELSRGGKDAVVVREFDLPSRTWVEDGFVLPEAKSNVTWLDRDTVLVGTDFGEGSLTTSGYPRTVRRWTRGTPLESAKIVFEAEPTDVAVSGWVSRRDDGGWAAVSRAVSIFEHEILVLDGDELRPLPVPISARPQGSFAGGMLFGAKEDWELPDRTIPAGAIFLADVPAFLATGELPAPEVIYAPDDHTTVEAMAESRSAIWLALLHDVRGELHRLTRGPDGWRDEKVALPENGTVSISSSSDFDDTVFTSYTDFLTPTRLMEVDPETLTTSVLKSTPAYFDATGCAVEQFFAESADGTRVPYFVVRRTDPPADGPVPTMLYGYGGFEISQKSQYISTWGKLWLERGGAFARANIRGGGEYGPRWHTAAQQEHRQISHDDFHAVAEDLIARGITDSDHLGIMGGSQGGLLVGVAFTQRPDLYAATVCQVPLLDMMRYHLLPPGASWMAEYGDPDDPEMAKVIRAYSPYQNLRSGVEYRNVFIDTSTKDDRVQPGHARKMVARMEELGQPVRYYENIEGGHAAGANRNQTAYRIALEFTHLSQALGLE